MPYSPDVEQRVTFEDTNLDNFNTFSTVENKTKPLSIFELVYFDASCSS